MMSRQGWIRVLAVVALIVAIAFGAWLWLRYSLRREVRRAIERIESDSGGAVKVSAADVSVDPIARLVTLRGVAIDLNAKQDAPTALCVDTLSVTKLTPLVGSRLPRELALEWHGVRSPSLDAWLAQMPDSVKKLVGDAPVFDVSHSVRYRPESENALDLEIVASSRLGEVSLRLAANGVDLSKVERIARERKERQGRALTSSEIQGLLFGALVQMQLRGARLNVRNAGLVEAIVAVQAAQRKTTEDAVRRSIQDYLRKKCDAPRAESWTQRICPPLRAFLDKPRSLQLVLEPAAPVGLLEVQLAAMGGGGDAVLKKLGLSLVTNQEP
jgi:hypothetical protein